MCVGRAVASSWTGGDSTALITGENVQTLISEPHEKCNTHSVSDALYQRHVEPTHYCVCSYGMLGARREIPGGISFWHDFLSCYPDDPCAPFADKGHIHDVFLVRSSDGLTVFVLPSFTETRWRGQC